MIKIENGVVTAEGDARTLTAEWYDLTVAVIKGLQENMGVRVTIQELIKGAEMIKQSENEEN